MNQNTRYTMFSRESELWSTPQDFFDSLNDEFHFTLDACALPENAKCSRYFTPDEDGLTQDWNADAVWCNPPYGRSVGNWVKKAAAESEKGRTVVMLLPARTDTKWFHEYIYNKAEIRFVAGRLRFGNSKNNAPFPSMVVIFRGVDIT